MVARYFALIAGIAYLAVGLLGFVPGATQSPPAGAPSVTVGAGYGVLLGFFPVNALHNIVHLVIGVLGIVAYRGFDESRLYARALAIVYGLLAVMGLVPALNTTFGLIPIFGHDVWLHALTAVVAAYVGWFAPVTTRSEHLAHA